MIMYICKTTESKSSQPFDLCKSTESKSSQPFNPENISAHIIAVTSRKLCHRPFPQQIERVCQFHPRAIILREKDLPENEYCLLAKNIMDICQSYSVFCILHTYAEVARKLHCPAIHLPLPLLRKYHKDLSDFNIIGASVHSVSEALEAEQLGARYITAGHIYATDCKKGVPPRGLPFLREVCEKVSIPVYAIGGIQPDSKQLSEIMSCGAGGGCVMSGMMHLR